MSTKLYDGIILDIPQDQFWNAVSEIRKNIEQTFAQLNTELTIDYLKNEYTASSIKNYRKQKGIPVAEKDEDHGLFLNALNRWKKEKEAFFKDKLNCKVQIYEPLEDGRILGYVFTNNQDEYVENLQKLDFIEEYGYWNNTDQPDELTEEQWDDRRKSWTTILDRDFFITGTGVSVDVAESKNRTFVMPSEELIDPLNIACADEDNSWKKSLSTRLVSELAMYQMKDIINEDVKQGSTTFMMGVIHSSIDVVQDAEILPVSDIPVWTNAELLKAGIVENKKPTIDETILGEMIQKVVEKSTQS